jgi:hypothetical protein
MNVTLVESPGQRPRWATGMAVVCLATLAFLVVRDLTIPAVRDTEVWFGFELTGRAAQLTAPLHWAIFALGAWGFWRVRPWIWPWAAIYAFGIAGGHLVWNLTSANGGGWSAGVMQALLFSIPAVALLFARPPASVPDAASRAQAGRSL